MAVFLSPVAGAAAQFLDNSGNVLSGGKLYTYVSGTTTPLATFTNSTGVTSHTNPIILDSAGRISNGGEIWLADNATYKFVLKTSADTLIATWDALTGINSNFLNYQIQSEIQTATADQTIFTLTEVTYTPGTGTLSVFVDGVKQYDGSAYSYVETDSTTVTFTEGLHVGALVQFTTSISLTAGATTADMVAYTPAGTDAVATNVQTKLRETVSVKDFGAVGDGVTDDYAAIQAAIDTGLPIYFPKATYNIGVYATPKILELNTEGQTIFLQGSTLKFLGKGGINALADNITIDCQGGTLTHFIGYAEVAVDTTPGSNTITVVDSSTLFVGQSLASSWSSGPQEYPLGGPVNPTFFVQNIVGNVVTLNKNMTGSTDYLAEQVIFGDFTFTPLLQGFKDNFTIKNGVMNRVSGYYYHTPNDTSSAFVSGGHVYFENMTFESNGTDQFLTKRNQKLHFLNCTSNQQWDTAKSGVYFADDGSVYMDNCTMHLGNFDSSFTLSNIWDSSISEGEIYINNSTIIGTTRFTNPPAGSWGFNNLQAIELSYEGTFDRISIDNCRFTGFSRHFVSSTVLPSNRNTALAALSVSNSIIDVNAFSFISTGAGKGFACTNARLSNCSFYVDSTQFYDFSTGAGINGATFIFAPEFVNCYFKLQASGYAKFSTPTRILGGKFVSTSYLHSESIAAISDTLFSNTTIAIAPTYDLSFFGDIGQIVVAHEDFPENPGNVFFMGGGSSYSGGVVAKAKSISGSVYYDVFKLGTNIAISGEFKTVNGTYFLRGDDYFIPVGSKITDTYNGNSYKVTFNLQTTLTASASAGATSVVVASATGIATGDKLNILCDNGLVSTVTVGAYTSGLTIPISALDYAAASGNKCNFFRVV